VDVVQGELGLGKLPQHKDAALLQELIDLSVVKLVVLDESSSAHFESLVVGPAVMTLDDGEAATIAYAAAHQATAILDERKANRICAERYSYLPIACSVDILSHPSVLQHLREQALADAVFNALYYGKMRVLPRHLDWVVTLIGPERAALCISLPHTVRIK
jgi:predicted nucleic acid-binding protein